MLLFRSLYRFAYWVILPSSLRILLRLPLYSLLVHLCQFGTVFPRGFSWSLFLVSHRRSFSGFPLRGCFSSTPWTFRSLFLFLDYVTHICIVSFDFTNWSATFFLCFGFELSHLNSRRLSFLLMHFYVFSSRWLFPGLLFRRLFGWLSLHT